MKADTKSHIYECRRLKLKELVDKFDTQKAFSEATGIDVTVISRMLYPEGKSNKRNIGEQSVRQIEDALNLSRGWMDGIGKGSELSSPGELVLITSKKYPVTSLSRADEWLSPMSEERYFNLDEWHESEARVTGEAFWVKIEGDSMASSTGQSIPAGSLVLFDTGRNETNGSLVLAKYVTANEATFKQLLIDGGQRYLKGLNPTWPPVPIDDDWKVIAIAIQAITKLV